ncbi:uncharacterized protein METZ01_LOCUS263591, partial [marine metagenome]
MSRTAASLAAIFFLNSFTTGWYS